MVKDAKPIYLDNEQSKVVAAWQIMGREIVWAALDAISEYLEVQDAELFIDSLIILQEYARVNR